MRSTANLLIITTTKKRNYIEKWNETGNGTGGGDEKVKKGKRFFAIFSR